MIRELKRLKPDSSLEELAAELAKNIANGKITGCVVLAAGPGGEESLIFAEGGYIDMGRMLYAFECWKRYTMDGGGQ